jgi:hypothetical protein
MKREFNAKEFIREVYLASEPSVDIDAVERINCTEHRLSSAKWEELLNEFCGDNNDLQFQCTMWCMNQGPCIYTV